MDRPDALRIAKAQFRALRIRALARNANHL